MAQRRRRPNLAARVLAWSSAGAMTRASGAFVLLLAVLLEVLPLTAWLATLAALAVNDPSLPALPFWLLYGAVLAAAGAGILSLPRRLPSGWAVLLITAGWLATLFVALRVSPAGYASVGPTGPFDLGWVRQIGVDILNGPSRLAQDVGLALLVAYTWWRGLRLSRDGASYERISLAFRLGLAAIILAVMADVAAGGAVRADLGRQLALMLPVEVGAGLAALALSHIEDFVRRHARPASGKGAPGDGDFAETPWLLTALGLAAAVVVGALLLALIFSYDALLALAQALAPVGTAVGGGVTWVTEVLALGLFIVLDQPYNWLLSHANPHPRQIQTPKPPTPVKTHTLTHPAQGIPPEWLVAARIVLLVALALVIVIVLARLVRRFRATPQEAQGFEETREGLNAGRMLGAQLRSLLAGLRARRVSATAEDLARWSVRRLYRDVLRAALRAGRARRASETPEEYLGRLAAQFRSAAPAGQDATLPVADLEALTGLYDQARYGELPDRAPDQEAALAESRRLVEWLERHPQR